ncbi:putative S-adenosylmethionine-dependent methyltransferase, YraL family [Halobacteroides halobius DSM 5150]|uniref:Ribosomal RNA small subunit methyltransferase I n=1 Tax=Halobacteroides halobius (strain ATCC 35273 / DSM 5150 / MD-1) TaxID=748449 RepID=L0K473_HALHC|nr:16S rRNA (cytidine(1402)-2'-O)-methyltransferase [Halobacteroides halobius]AGB40087.1 putative S-adenosylmethionine-dependent methyltransferase, YraL family [Halobacteroides halobius DSM 5150]
MTKGTLYICGTPIGNLKDITLRALDILKEVDLIAAEDTRRTSKLLNYYEIKTKLTSYHEHNADDKKKELLAKLETNNDIALVSDAGMPGISDPGYKLVKLLRNEGIEIRVVPGPTAMTSAIVSSGLPTNKFSFEGFLPRKKSERQKYLQQLKSEERTMIYYEAPHRLVKTLKDILDVLGNRKIAVCRELTKKFEEVLTERVSDLLDYFKNNKPQGEIVLVVEGGNNDKSTDEWKSLSILEHVKQEMKTGLTKKEAIKEVAKLRELPKSEVYQIATKIRVNK